jgi:hypothetical protein
MNRRIRLSLRATFSGWCAGTLYTLLFEGFELWRNASAGNLAHDLSAGLALWIAFSLAVGAAIWCVAVLPIAVWAPPLWIVRRRWPIAWTSSLGAVGLVGWKLGTWTGFFEPGPESPLQSVLFWEYAGFSFAVAWVTTHEYARLLRASLEA